MSFHRACCCGAGGFQLVVVGVDATACLCVPGGLDHYSTAALSVDGTFDLVFSHTLGNGNDVYTTASVGTFELEYYTIFDDGCTEPDSTDDLGGVSWRVEIDPSTDKVKRIWVFTAVGNNGASGDGNIFLWTGTDDFDVALSNQQACVEEYYTAPPAGVPKPAATGGTAKVVEV